MIAKPYRKRNFKIWFFSFSAFILLTILSIQSPIGITFFPLIMIVFTPLLFILWLLKVENFMKIQIKGYAVPLMTAIFISFFVSVGIIKYQSSGSIDRSSVILYALEKYNTDYNSYPAELNELNQGYLHDIPKTKMGWMNVGYEYTVYNQKKEFKLGFKYIAMLSYYYDSERKKWEFE